MPLETAPYAVPFLLGVPQVFLGLALSHHSRLCYNVPSQKDGLSSLKSLFKMPFPLITIYFLLLL